MKSSKVFSGKEDSAIKRFILERVLVMACLLRFRIWAIPTGEMPIFDSQHNRFACKDI